MNRGDGLFSRSSVRRIAAIRGEDSARPSAHAPSPLRIYTFAKPAANRPAPHPASPRERGEEPAAPLFPSPRPSRGEAG